MYGIVYLAQNQITNECYVGATTKTLDSKKMWSSNEFRKKMMGRIPWNKGKSNCRCTVAPVVE